MYLLFVDVETNGKPKDERIDYRYVDNWPRITELAFQFVNFPEGNILKEFNTLIKPNGWTIPTNESFFASNGMSTERCEAEGVPIEFALETLRAYVDHADIIIAHKWKFDGNCINAELIRAKMKPITREHITLCTMETTRGITRIPNMKWPGFKPPKLSELYQKLFDTPMIGNHVAGFDTVAVKEIVFELVRRDALDLHKYLKHEQAKRAPFGKAILAAAAGNETGGNGQQTEEQQARQAAKNAREGRIF